ncbi:unnamed protein product, partial [Closterium sp. NIES-53]
MGGKWGAISKLHAFPKAEDHLTQKTLSGAIVTLLGVAIMVVLFAHELSFVLTPEVHEEEASAAAVEWSSVHTANPPLPFFPLPSPPLLSPPLLSPPLLPLTSSPLLPSPPIPSSPFPPIPVPIPHRW